MFGKNLAMLHSKLFTRKKFISFIKFIVKCEWKKCWMKVIKYRILYCVFARTFVSDTIFLRFRNQKYLRFRFRFTFCQVRFRFRFRFHKAKSYDSYGSLSDSTTLSSGELFETWLFPLFGDHFDLARWSYCTNVHPFESKFIPHVEYWD